MGGSDKFADILAPGLGKWARGKAPKMETPDMPPPVEEVDVAGQKQYTKQRLKAKKGRQSTILSGLGVSNQQKKTTLG